MRHNNLLADLKSFENNNEIVRYEPCVDTSKLYQTLNLPKRFETPYMFRGYGIQRSDLSPVYKTTNSEYGWYTPCIHSVPHRYFPRSNEFSDLLAKCGMYRNYSLNTLMDRSIY